MEPINQLLPIAALIHQDANAADAELQLFINYLFSQDKHVLGFIQAPETVNQQHQSKMGIINLADGRYHSIAQYLGEHNSSCCLDSAAVSAASHALTLAREEKPDLIIINRFGKLEAEGLGFADEMLEIMSSSIPLLTIVPERFLGAWRIFCGGLSTELPPTLPHIKQWFDQLFYSPTENLQQQPHI